MLCLLRKLKLCVQILRCYHFFNIFWICWRGCFYCSGPQARRYLLLENKTNEKSLLMNDDINTGCNNSLTNHRISYIGVKILKKEREHVCFYCEKDKGPKMHLGDMKQQSSYLC